MPICVICSAVWVDLTQHLKRDHQMSVDDYKKNYSSIIIDLSVEEKRKATCERLYGNPNYKNEEAKKLSNEVFEGGHSLRDPIVREKGKKTKEELYGDSNFTNREKAKKTTMDRYGYEYTCQVPEVIEKRVATLKARYGKVFNITEAHNKWHLEKPEEFKFDYASGMTLFDMSNKYKISETTLRDKVKELGLSRTMVSTTKRIVETAAEAAERYLKECLKSNKVLSFYEYGKITGQPNCTKMKRLFNARRPYNYLLGKLSEVALHPELHTDFLSQMHS